MPLRKKRKDDGKICAHVVIYTRYERFWHWTQAALIFTLAFTGLNIHGAYHVMSMETAVVTHDIAATLLVLLWIFTTFWNFTTGNWRQFLPFLQVHPEDGRFVTGLKIFLNRLWAVIRYYAWGILRGEPHPHKKTLQRKQNPLQALAYLTFMIVIGPALWISGIFYILYDLWNDFAGSQMLFQATVFVHTAAAFAMVAFVIIHVYMTTTGKTPLHYIKGMITGVEEVELSEIEREYLETHMPDMLKDENASC